MSFLEPIIAVLLGAGGAALADFIRKNLAFMRFLKYGPIVKKAYDIIDPVLDQNLARWDGSKVDKAFELAIVSVADGKLTGTEIKNLAIDMAKNWLPQVAADKVRAFEASAPELLAARLIAARIDGE